LCLSSFSVLCTQCCQFVFVFVQCLVYPMLPVFVCHKTLNEDKHKLATLGTQDTERRQTQTGNIGYTRHWTKTNKNWQHWVHKTLNDCVPNVASFCLSSFSVLCTQCCQFLFVFVQCLVYPMLPGFVCLRSVSCVPNVASFSGLSILTTLRFSPSISNEFAVTWGSALTLRILTKRYLIECHGVEVGAIRSP
jgi:hypothetical protein